MNQIASRVEVERFLADTEFSGYQSVPLPHGQRVPGNDKSRAVDFYLSGRVAGKSLLDIGTYYGLYPCEAMERGAARAVGVELDPGRYAIATRIAELHGSKYEIVQSRIEDFPLGETFEVVLFLNVLHHVLDPIEAVRNVAKLCSGTLIVEFCLPWDHHYIRFLHNSNGKPIGKISAGIRSEIMKLTCRHLPVMGVGNREYHRTFYFSPEAFENVFALHHKLFKSIEFLPSPMGRYRAVAICQVA